MSESVGTIPSWYRVTPAAERAQVEAAVGERLARQLAETTLVVLDVDGVLTSGDLLYGARGETLKAFNAKDGLGLILARTVGIKRAVLTGRRSDIVARRTGELHFDIVKMGRFDKAEALREILAESDSLPERTLYMGDDLIDMAAMEQVGLAVTVPEAPAVVREACGYVTTAAGGRGAVREVMDLLLMSRGMLGEALGRLGDPRWRPTAKDLSTDETG